MNRHRAKMKMNSKLHVIARAFIRLPNAIEWCATIPHPLDFGIVHVDIFFSFFLNRAIAPLNTCTHTHTHRTTMIFFPRSSFPLSLFLYFDYFTFAQLIRISHPEHLQKNGKVTKNEQSEKKYIEWRRFTPKTNAIISYKNEQQKRRERRRMN